MNISDKLRSLTYSLDIQMTRLYFWCGNFVIQLSGTEVDDEPFYYPFVVRLLVLDLCFLMGSLGILSLLSLSGSTRLIELDS